MILVRLQLLQQRQIDRSPMGGLNSSSDDSNCSNQTTHSMVTSVASPPNSSVKIETSSITSNNSNHNNTTNHHQQQSHNETMVRHQNNFCCNLNNNYYNTKFPPTFLCKEIYYYTANGRKYFAKIAPTFFQYHTTDKLFFWVRYAFFGTGTDCSAVSIWQGNWWNG